jgi:hypothetical protein
VPKKVTLHEKQREYERANMAAAHIVLRDRPRYGDGLTEWAELVLSRAGDAHSLTLRKRGGKLTHGRPVPNVFAPARSPGQIPAKRSEENFSATIYAEYRALTDERSREEFVRR